LSARRQIKQTARTNQGDRKALDRSLLHSPTGFVGQPTNPQWLAPEVLVPNQIIESCLPPASGAPLPGSLSPVSILESLFMLILGSLHRSLRREARRMMLQHRD
jgi:hypothetical protein